MSASILIFVSLSLAKTEISQYIRKMLSCAFWWHFRL